MNSDISALKAQIRDIDKNISDIKNVLSTYSDYFKSHFSHGPGGTKNDEFKTPPPPFSPLRPEVFHPDKLLYDDVIHRLKASDSWVFLRAMLEMNYLDMDLFNFIPWLEGVSKYASTLLEASKAYRPMQNYLEHDFYGDSFE